MIVSIATHLVFAIVLVGFGVTIAKFLVDLDSEYLPVESRQSLPPYPAAAEENIFWFVQVSDIHVSRYYDPNRTRDLETFCGAHLPFISPALVLITGDLTDAKSADFHSSQQFRDEWQRYQAAVHASGAQAHYPFLDLRGNHDGFDTPMKSGYDSLYRSFSIRNARKTSGHEALYVHSTPFGNYSFVAVDAVPRPGPKRPFNFFGIIDEERLVSLQHARAMASKSNHTIFYGHYPSSFIHQPYFGALRSVLAGGTAYLSGHLHDLGGLADHLYAQQTSGQLELELADWRVNRRFRILAFDHDLLSFGDYEFNEFPTVLITNPKSAEFHVRNREPLGRMRHSSHIRVLVFSPRIITSVKVFIDGRALGNAVPTSTGSHLYVIRWSPSDYSEGFHTVTVEASDTKFKAKMGHVFSLDNSRVKLRWFPTAIFRVDLAFMFKLAFVGAWLAVIAVLYIARWHPRLVLPSPSSHAWNWFPSTRRGLCCFAKDLPLLTCFCTAHVYVGLGPCLVAELLTDHYGLVFFHGVFVEGHFLPGSLTYFYGFLQIIIFHCMLLLHFSWLLDHKQRKSHHNTLSTLSRKLGTLLVYSPAVLGLLFQAMSCRSMCKAYGLTALLLGFGHSWVLLAGVVGVIAVSCRR